MAHRLDSLLLRNPTATIDTAAIIIAVRTVLARDTAFINAVASDSAFVRRITSVGDGLYWPLTGSRGTDPARNFIGTADNRSLAFRANNIERLRIDAASGFVGIGTAAPAEQLHVAGNIRVAGLTGGGSRFAMVDSIGTLRAATGAIVVGAIDTLLARDSAFVTSLTTGGLFINRFHVLGDTSYWSLTGSVGFNPARQFLGTTDGSPLAVRTNNVERMRVDAAGNVGIGTQAPGERLETIPRYLIKKPAVRR